MTNNSSELMKNVPWNDLKEVDKRTFIFQLLALIQTLENDRDYQAQQIKYLYKLAYKSTGDE